MLKTYSLLRRLVIALSKPQIQASYGTKSDKSKSGTKTKSKSKEKIEEKHEEVNLCEEEANETDEKSTKGDHEDGDEFFRPVSPKVDTCNKITIAGIGAVGLAAASVILAQRVTHELVLIDSNKDRLLGETSDFQHAAQFADGANIKCSTEYDASAGSRICIIAAGKRTKTDQSRLEVAQSSADIVKAVVPRLVECSPDTVLVVVANPCDVMAYVALKTSGLPKHRVIGSGTNLDSARFRCFLSQRLDVSPLSCHAYVIGEHGDSSVPVWSNASVGGIMIRGAHPQAGLPDDPDKWYELHKKVVQGGYEVHKLKGYTSWGIAFSLSNICDAIMKNKQQVIPVSVPVKGWYDVKEDVCLSLPAVLGEEGVHKICKLPLSEEEIKAFQKSAKTLDEVIKKIKL